MWRGGRGRASFTYTLPIATFGYYHSIQHMPFLARAKSIGPFTCTHPSTTCGYYHPIRYMPLSVGVQSITACHTCVSAHSIVSQRASSMIRRERCGFNELTQMYLPTKIQRGNIQGLLQDCNARKDLASSRQLQFWMVCHGLECLPLYGDYLIRSFALCTALQHACQVFLKISTPTAYTWNAIISAHVQLFQGEQALALYFRMQEVGVKVDRVTFLCILKVCSDLGVLWQGKLIHMMIVEMGSDADLVIGSTLIHMYGKCASLEEAHKVFDGLPNPNVVSWGVLITGYAQYGDGMMALQLFKNMQVQGLKPEKATFLCALKACGNVGAATEGRLIHDRIIRTSLHVDVAITSALIDMYGKCARLSESLKLFRDARNHDVVSWASFISSYAQHGCTFNVLELLEEMEQGGITPDYVIYLCILRVCFDMAGVQGRLVHDRIIKANFELNTAVASSLVNMYAKSGCLQEAENIFNKVETHNLVSCSAMISGYVQEGHGFLACAVFEEMQDAGIKPDKVSFLGALKACGSLGAIHKGRGIHSSLVETRLDADVSIGNTLVDMYTKCGSLQEAHRVFDMLSERDIVSWHAMISGYAQQGNCILAMNFVESMQCQGFTPDDTIYMSVLAGCSNAGLLKEGYFYFKSMWQDHDISPSVKHYNCMIDLLGRMGHLIDGQDMLQTMPVSSNLIGWSTLLSGCRSHGNIELGTHCFSELFHLDSTDASCYMIMSSLYASTERMDAANQLQKFRRDRRAWKKPGGAWIEIGTKLHEFIVNDCLSQDSIFLSKSNRIGLRMKEHGHLPDLDALYESMVST